MIQPINPQNFPCIYYGHPLVLSEEKNKFVPVWNQQATDEKGRKKFHGAFTGGFTAGYHNTVGSKEGWRPSEYKKNTVSSRQDSLLSIMDEEDLRDYSLQMLSNSTAPNPQLSSIFDKLGVIPIFNKDDTVIKFDSTLPSLFLINESARISSAGKLSLAPAGKHEEEDEINYEETHCYSAFEDKAPHSDNHEAVKNTSQVQLEISPSGHLPVYTTKGYVPQELILQPQDVPENFNTCRKDSIVLVGSMPPSPYNNGGLFPSEADAALSSKYEPFHSDREKQERYKSFLGWISKGNPVADYKVSSQAETEEFIKAAKLFKPLSYEMSQRFTSSLSSSSSTNPLLIPKDEQMVVSSTCTISWIPSSILCKRLGIEPPFKNQVAPQLPTSSFVKEILDQKTMAAMVQSSSFASHTLSLDPDNFLPGLLSFFKNRPPLSFFQEIFVPKVAVVHKRPQRTPVVAARRPKGFLSFD